VSPPGEPWFAIWTRSQYEPRVEDGLRAKGFEVFLPRVRVPSRRQDRCLVLERPLFPSYVLARFAPSRTAYLRVVSTDGVVRILGERWDALHPIPESQVEAVRRVVDGADGARPSPWLRLGDQVRIVAGPLAGLEGRVQAWRGARATFVVNVDLLHRGVAAEVPAAVVQRV
jgi:transcription antitermination factor NusG